MKTILIGFLALTMTSSYAATLIECDGIDNPNNGIIRIVTNKAGDLSTKALIASFKAGTAFYHLSNVEINKNNKTIIDHTEANGTRLVVTVSKEQLTDGSNTIRPFYYKSKVYFDVPGATRAAINSRYMKCRTFNNFF